MDSSKLYLPLGLAVFSSLTGSIDTTAPDTARNQRLALFRNDLCYDSLDTSAAPIPVNAAACRLTSHDDQSVAFEAFVQAIQQDPGLLERAERKLSNLSPQLQAQIRQDLSALSQERDRQLP